MTLVRPRFDAAYFPPINVARVLDLAICCVPKCANTAIKWALLDAQGVPLANRRHRHAQLSLGAPEETAGYYTAAFLRYPAARLYSAWHDKIRQRNGPASRRLEAMGFRIGMSFDAFVHAVIAQDCEDMHLRPQIDFLAPVMDFIGTVESIAYFWPKLQARFPWLPALTQENISANNAWRAHCGPELLAWINRHYAEDVARWSQAQREVLK
jgi:hypothetical protein